MAVGLDYDAQDRCLALGRSLPSNTSALARIIRELLPHAGPGCAITSPFFCDYG